MDPTDVFVHRGYPEETYVEREESTKGKESFEDQLYSSLRKGFHVKISGPSKSGKTQLVIRVAKNRLTENAFIPAIAIPFLWVLYVLFILALTQLDPVSWELLELYWSRAV